MNYTQLLTGILMVAATLIAGCNTPAKPADKSPEPEPVVEEEVPETPTALNPKVFGEEDAPVTLVEYADFQCSWCARAYFEVFRELEPLIDKGLLRYEYRHRIVFDNGSLLAAQAAECAAEQSEFEDFFRVMNKKFDPQSEMTEERLLTYAEKIRLKTRKFQECLESGKYEDLILAQDQEAQELGVKGTPSFFINGEQFRPQESLQEVVDAVKAAIEEATAAAE